MFLVVVVVLVAAVAGVERAIAVVMVKIQRYVNRQCGKRTPSECVGGKEGERKGRKKNGRAENKVGQMI